MNVRNAINDTMVLALAGNHFHPVSGPLSLKYLIKMKEESKAANMSEYKLNRWLGWMQATVVSWGSITLKDMNQINKKHKGNF